MKDKKVVLITGCSSGFGFLAALEFAHKGWQTFAGIRDLESPGAKELWEIKKKENLPLEILPLDVTSQLSVEEAVQMAVSRAGRIDVLVNNAGFGYFGPVEELSIDEVKAQYETNVFGVLRMVKSVAPIMRRQGSGRIINISSISGRMVLPLYGVYASSKYALEALSESLNFELSHFGIKVILVEPGSFSTNFVSNVKYPKNVGESVYGSLSKTFFERLKGSYKTLSKSAFFRAVANPEKVSDLIFNISQSRNPKLRYLVGDARLYHFLRQLTPNFVWQRLLHRAYKW